MLLLILHHTCSVLALIAIMMVIGYTMYWKIARAPRLAYKRKYLLPLIALGMWCSQCQCNMDRIYSQDSCASPVVFDCDSSLSSQKWKREGIAFLPNCGHRWTYHLLGWCSQYLAISDHSIIQTSSCSCGSALVGRRGLISWGNSHSWYTCMHTYLQECQESEMN